MSSGYTEDQREQTKRVYNKALANAHKALAYASNAPCSPIRSSGQEDLAPADDQLEKVVSAYCLDGGWVMSVSQVSGCSEFGRSDAQLAKLARTSDLLATDGDGSAGASAGYPE